MPRAVSKYACVVYKPNFKAAVRCEASSQHFFGRLFGGHRTRVIPLPQLFRRAATDMADRHASTARREHGRLKNAGCFQGVTPLQL